jgi:amidase
MLSDEQIPFATAIELAQAIREGKLSSRHCLEVLVARMEQINPMLNAVVYTDLEKARARADEADVAISAGQIWGPLHGVPMTIKENNDVKGMPITMGNLKHKDRVSPQSEVAVQRLQDAGVVVFGKTNLPLDAMDVQSYNEIYGSTGNPWDLAKTPGGSSGGGSAAVACGITPIELGGDVGGSIRIPAAFTGIYGHKPTFGLIPKSGPTTEHFPKEVSVRGPLARSAEDLRVLMEILAEGPRVGEAFASKPTARAWRLQLSLPTKTALKQYKIAIWADDEQCRVHDDLTTAAEQVGRALEGCGASVDWHARPNFDTASNHRTYFKLTAANAVVGMSEADEEALPAIAKVSLRTYRQAQEERERIRLAWEDFFDTDNGGFDILICPSFSTPAFNKDERYTGFERAKRTLHTVIDGEEQQVPYFSALWWAFLTNVGLLPSTTFPCGVGSISKMPLGLNVVSREYNDMICIDVARLLASECGFECQPPPMQFGPPAISRL